MAKNRREALKQGFALLGFLTALGLVLLLFLPGSLAGALVLRGSGLVHVKIVTRIFAPI